MPRPPTRQRLGRGHGPDASPACHPSSRPGPGRLWTRATGRGEHLVRRDFSLGVGRVIMTRKSTQERARCRPGPRRGRGTRPGAEAGRAPAAHRERQALWRWGRHSRPCVRRHLAGRTRTGPRVGGLPAPCLPPRDATSWARGPTEPPPPPPPGSSRQPGPRGYSHVLTRAGATARRQDTDSSHPTQPVSLIHSTNVLSCPRLACPVCVCPPNAWNRSGNVAGPARPGAPSCRAAAEGQTDGQMDKWVGA